MVANSREYMREYMKGYVERNSQYVQCEICAKEIKKYNIYLHKKTKTCQRIKQVRGLLD